MTQLLLPELNDPQFEVHTPSEDKYEEGQLRFSFKPSMLNEMPALYVSENSLCYPASRQG